jgi:aspartate 1-decarboxylase
MLTMLKCKLHGARVTETILHYEGSIGIDEELLEVAGLLPFELVHVWNVTNGQRFETYVITQPPGSGSISVNGAAARLVALGDELIIAAFAQVPESEARAWQPTVVILNANNKPAHATA